MGSGKGRARRANAMTAAPPALGQLTFDPSKWQEFVQDSALEEYNIRQYYCGTKRPSARHRPYSMHFDDYAKIVSELFADAVVAGAIILPATYTSTDFIFSAEERPGQPDGQVKARQVFVTLEGKPDSRRSLGQHEYWLVKGTTMGQSIVPTFLEAVAHVVNELL